jgi:hypothetical protein
MITDERWHAAQDAEADWHRSDAWAHIGTEVRTGVRGMLRIGASGMAGKRVIDVGCGPHSIMLDIAHVLDVTGCAALDPLTFRDVDERVYARWRIPRVMSAVELYQPWTVDGWRRFDEAWCYNCLQHVRDVDVALSQLQSYAGERVRLFEWLNVPETVNHPHVLTADRLRNAFDAREWRVEYEYVGRWRAYDFAQDYLALSLARVT